VEINNFMRLGISSFTFPWAIGGIDSDHPVTMTAFELLEKAETLGADVLQIADNLPIGGLSNEELAKLRAKADAVGIALEVGTRGIASKNIEKFLEIAAILGSPILRIVIDTKEHEPTLDEINSLLAPFADQFRNLNIKLAIENHDRLTCAQFNEIIDRLGDDWVGICLDTVNSLGAVEAPNTVVPALAPRAINVHMKDFEIVRSNGQMGFTVQGTALGQGRLDVQGVIAAVGGPKRDITSVIELWTPRQSTYEETIALEQSWAAQSVSFLRASIGLKI
jgi:sugar phosphate isomerase/epimerase